MEVRNAVVMAASVHIRSHARAILARSRNRQMITLYFYPVIIYVRRNIVTTRIILLGVLLGDPVLKWVNGVQYRHTQLFSHLQ